MVKYVLKRIALMFFVFFTILTVCFVLVKLLPLVDAKQFGKDMNLIQQRREALGYNKPILIQYLIFLKRSVIGGDWGISEALYRSQDVWKVFTSKLPATMMVNIYSERTAAWYFCCIKEKQVAGLSYLYTCHGIYFRSVLCICTVNPVFALL